MCYSFFHDAICIYLGCSSTVLFYMHSFIDNIHLPHGLDGDDHRS